jgi:heme-NO-binding protein
LKGIIFNLVEEVVTDRYGEDTWDALLDAAGLDGSYTSLGSYDDEQLFKLVEAAAAALGVPPDVVVRQLGEGAIPLLVDRYPAFFEDFTSAQGFLLTLNDIIHPEVRKLYPGAEVPDFDFATPEEGVLVIGYRSRRQLCALAEGFIIGAARHYGEQVDVSQPRCLLRGDDQCLIRCAFSAADAA